MVLSPILCCLGGGLAAGFFTAAFFIPLVLSVIWFLMNFFDHYYEKGSSYGY